MKDMRMDDLRRLEIDAMPDPAFVSRSLATVLDTVRESRRRDATISGRLSRRLATATTGWGPGPEAWRLLRLPIVVLLLLALLYAALITAGALLRAPVISGGNGLAVATFDGDLTSVDPTDGSRRLLLPPGTMVGGASRSPDGRLVSFWSDLGTRLEIIGIDGTGRRHLATTVDVTGLRCFDVWSSDSSRLATEVVTAGNRRIMVVDVATGHARFVTDPGLQAGCPLWSPDGQFVAFAYDRPTGRRGVGIVTADGTRFHDIGGEIDGRTASGTNSWSPEGSWVYFDAVSGGGRIYRASVDRRFSEPLTDAALSAFAPAVSPDGTQLSFIVERAHTFDLFAARSDGYGARLILADASNEGWSADSEFIMTRWAPASGGGLTIVRPDGTGLRVLVPFDKPCKVTDCPGSGASWGQPRP